MINKSVLKKNIIFIPGTVLTTVLLAFVFNAYRQAYILNKSFMPQAQIAVFVDAGRKVANEVIMEKLVNLDGVDKADFIPKDKILENAQNENSQLRGIVISGENPFSPYYLVYPKHVSVSYADMLVGNIRKIDGVSDAVFDEHLFSAVEKTGRFVDFYRVSGKAAVIVVLLFIVLKFVYRQLNNETDLLNYIYNFVLGIVSGVLGACVYYLVTKKIVHLDIVQLPVKYMVYFIACGVLTVFFWEND
jgi:hypothetical protein